MRSVIALILCLALPAAAESKEVKRFLNAAITLYENLEYEKALKQIAKAKAKVTGTEDEARASLLEGVVLADMGQEEKALTAFKTGFGLDLEGKLPVDVSPKVQAVAERARANVRKLLTPRLEAQKAEEDRRLAEEKAKQDELTRAAAEDKRRQEEEAARNAPPPAVGASGSGPSVRGLSWIPGAAGLVSAGVGIYFLASASGKLTALQEHSVDLATAERYRTSGPTDAALGYVFVGVGVAAVVAAGAMFAFGAPPSPSSPQLAFIPLQGGGFLSLSYSGL
jgi:hypothetical protein